MRLWVITSRNKTQPLEEQISVGIVLKAGLDGWALLLGLFRGKH